MSREAPDQGVTFADCRLSLDPLHILPNAAGTWNRGVFQISYATLRGLGGAPLDALDPEWNIRAAHRLRNRAKSFDDWPNCLGHRMGTTPSRDGASTS